MKQYLAGARVVLPDDVIEDAAVLVEDDQIVAVNPESGGRIPATVLSGLTLMPGMVDLHCDAIEKEVEPRPDVHFPLAFAVQQADRRNALAGITTGFHALSFAEAELGVRNTAMAADVVHAIRAAQPRALVDNRAHCRYEVTDSSAVAILSELMQQGAVNLLSFMDHTPGQGQFKSVTAYRQFLCDTYASAVDEVETLVERKCEAGAGADARIRQLSAVADDCGVALASHDDDHQERVAAMSALGVTISEFPVNLEAAIAARDAGMATVLGAPNALRNRSQSGSMKALEAVAADVADCLCADYAPAALLGAVFTVHREHGLTLPAATALATLYPARAAGLYDRGTIVPGQRADLIAVDTERPHPSVEHLWCAGRHSSIAGAGRG